ncbi:GNAT family N-acetyltransferase [Candidatus Cloacimonadota bacterium]
MELKLVTALERADLLEQEKEINSKIWPDFMFHDEISNKYFSRLYEIFPEYQLFLLQDNKIMGIGNSIPLSWNKDLNDLPDEGWDWAIEKGFHDYFENRQANFLCGLLIAVTPEFRGLGISSKILSKIKEKAIEKRCDSLIIPVRPILKSKHPEVEMSEYIGWKRADDQVYDPWLRIHYKMGGEMIKVCNKAMLIQGSVEDWSKWTGMEFPESGKYIIPGALRPVEFDLAKDKGVYLEPNVWIIHEL